MLRIFVLRGTKQGGAVYPANKPATCDDVTKAKTSIGLYYVGK